MEHDSDPHSVSMLEQAFAWALVIAAVFAVGSCIAGMG